MELFGQGGIFVFVILMGVIGCILYYFFRKSREKVTPRREPYSCTPVKPVKKTVAHCTPEENRDLIALIRSLAQIYKNEKPSNGGGR